MGSRLLESPVVRLEFLAVFKPVRLVCVVTLLRNHAVWLPITTVAALLNDLLWAHHGMFGLNLLSVKDLPVVSLFLDLVHPLLFLKVPHNLSSLFNDVLQLFFLIHFLLLL